MEHNSSLVNLSIPQNVTAPIIAAKIQEAVLAAMGGADKIVEGVVHQICNTKVNPKDGKVSGYSSENSMLWMDYHITSILQGAINEELKKQTVEISSPVKDALIKTLQTKAGASKAASLIMDSFLGSNIKMTFDTKQKTNNDW